MPLTAQALLPLKIADHEVRYCNTFLNIFPVIKDVAAASVTAKRIFFVGHVTFLFINIAMHCTKNTNNNAKQMYW